MSNHYADHIINALRAAGHDAHTNPTGGGCAEIAVGDLSITDGDAGIPDGTPDPDGVYAIVTNEEGYEVAVVRDSHPSAAARHSLDIIENAQ